MSLVGAESTVTRWLHIVDPERSPNPIKGVKAVQGRLYSRALLEYIEERWGLCGPKSGKLTWPEDLPSEMFVHFARGLWDTDGTLYVEKRRHREGRGNDTPGAGYTSKDRVFITRLRDALSEAFKAPKVKVCRESNDKGVWYTIKYGGNSSMLVANALYAGAPSHLVNDDRLEAYQRMLGTVTVTKPLCKCGAPARDHGVCKACWWQARRDLGNTKSGKGTSCSTEGCSKEVLAKGLCSACYSRKRRGPAPPKPTTVACSYEGCERPSRARGFCSSCYVRDRRLRLKAESAKVTGNLRLEVRGEVQRASGATA